MSVTQQVLQQHLRRRIY